MTSQDAPMEKPTQGMRMLARGEDLVFEYRKTPESAVKVYSLEKLRKNPLVKEIPVQAYNPISRILRHRAQIGIDLIRGRKEYAELPINQIHNVKGRSFYYTEAQDISLHLTCYDKEETIWELGFKVYNVTPLASAKWNDREGINELINRFFDLPACEVEFALKEPENANSRMEEYREMRAEHEAYQYLKDNGFHLNLEPLSPVFNAFNARVARLGDGNSLSFANLRRVTYDRSSVQGAVNIRFFTNLSQPWTKPQNTHMTPYKRDFATQREDEAGAMWQAFLDEIIAQGYVVVKEQNATHVKTLEQSATVLSDMQAYPIFADQISAILGQGRVDASLFGIPEPMVNRGTL